MSDTWNRGSFRAGGEDYSLLNEMKAQEAEGAGREREEGGRDDGRGDAAMGGAPRPQPGDELYDTLHQAKAETAQRQQAEPEPSKSYALEFAAMIALTSGQQNDQQQQDQPGPEQGSQYQQAAQEAQQPEPEAEAGPNRPGAQEQPQGLSADFVTDDTRQEVAASHSQDRQRQRSMSLGL